MGTTPTELFRQVLSDLPRGAPISSKLLTRHGIAPKAVARFGTEGWLHRLGRGVYLLPGDKLERDAALAWLAARIPGLHVAGKTALDWRGVRHNVAMREVLSLWGDADAVIPSWFDNAFPCRYQATHLFDAALPGDAAIAPLPFKETKVPVSMPERAVLELLSDAGKRQSLEETENILENTRALRLDVLDELMSHLTRIKVARLADKLSASLQLPWHDIATKHSRRLGGGARWVTRAKTGERIDLKGPK